MNGEKICNVIEEEIISEVGEKWLSSVEEFSEPICNKDIKSILTKEQFREMEYKVNE